MTSPNSKVRRTLKAANPHTSTASTPLSLVREKVERANPAWGRIQRASWAKSGAAFENCCRRLYGDDVYPLPEARRGDGRPREGGLRAGQPPEEVLRAMADDLASLDWEVPVVAAALGIEPRERRL